MSCHQLTAHHDCTIRLQRCDCFDTTSATPVTSVDAVQLVGEHADCQWTPGHVRDSPLRVGTRTPATHRTHQRSTRHSAWQAAHATHPVEAPAIPLQAESPTQPHPGQPLGGVECTEEHIRAEGALPSSRAVKRARTARRQVHMRTSNHRLTVLQTTAMTRNRWQIP
jgi:hypothetical protein